MADPSLLPCLSPPQHQHTALPQAMMNPSDAMMSATGVGAKSGRQTTTTTRVLLRVKRRRPSPTSAHDASTVNSTQPSATGTAATTDNTVGNGGASAPDRIQLALPCILEGSSKKRRKLAEKQEELALIRRLDSGMSIHNNNHHNNSNDYNGSEATNKEGTTADTSNAAVFHTPTRRGSSLGGGNNNPHDEEVVPLASGQCTPPSNISKLLNNNSPHTTHTATTTTTTTTSSETPAPPTKPKRTVIFRKISNLQKRILDPETALSKANGHDSQELSIDTNTAAAAQESQMASTTAGEGGGWSPLCESKSKWLRIVDVMLNEDDEDVDQVSSICSSSNTTNDNTNIGSNAIMGDGNCAIVGSGQRVRRMRPRPSLENDDNHEEEGKGRRSGKRRKLGWVVEQSRTVLESDFWNGQIGCAGATATATMPTAAATSATAAAISSNNTRGNIHNKSNNKDDLLDPEVVRLIEYSLCALHQQNGGSVSPHLSFLKADPRLGGFTSHTPRSRRMVNHALLASTAYSSDLMGKDLQEEAGGRTVLHLAALFGDLSGTLAALEMGADPTIHDARGNTPVGLARKGGYDEVVKILVEAERKAVQEKDVRCDGNGGEYYYDVYCLEETTTTIDDGKEASGTKTKNDSIDNPSQVKSSQFLQPKNATTASSTALHSDSIPDLERSSVLSEDDDTTISSNKNHRNSHCALIELQKGFGYWNERGELILEPVAGDDEQRVGVVSGSGDGKISSADNNDEDEDDDARFVQRFYNNNMGEDDSMGDNEEEHDSNNEGYDGNDYPEEYSFGMDSDDDDDDDYRDADHAYGDARSDDDDDSEDDWKLDFRKRFVSRSALDQYDFGSNDGEEMG